MREFVGHMAQGGHAIKAANFIDLLEAVVDSNDQTASTALLELTTLVNAILYTQGATPSWSTFLLGIPELARSSSYLAASTILTGCRSLPGKD